MDFFGNRAHHRFKLHKSAYSYPAQWANTESQSFPFAWMNAGYLSEQLDLNAQSIVFRKAGSIPNKATITKVREERLEKTKKHINYLLISLYKI